MGPRGGRRAARSPAWSGCTGSAQSCPSRPVRSRSGGASIPTTGATVTRPRRRWPRLRHGFDVVGLDEIVAFTTTVNTRSQAVMVRIGMSRDTDGDFDHPALPEDSPLRRHVLYRIGASQLPPTVAA